MKLLSGNFIAAMVVAFLTTSANQVHAYYDPGPQRWINRDPIDEEGSLNLYELAENAPLTFVDTDGCRSTPFPLRLPVPPPILRPPPVVGSVLGPIGIACTCGSIAAVAIDTGSKIYCDEKQKRCDKEWDDAFKMCKEELSKPNPSRAITGGYKNIMDCARGLVSEDCGGNPVDHGKKKKTRTIRF